MPIRDLDADLQAIGVSPQRNLDADLAAIGEVSQRPSLPLPDQMGSGSMALTQMDAGRAQAVPYKRTLEQGLIPHGSTERFIAETYPDRKPPTSIGNVGSNLLTGLSQFAPSMAMSALEKPEELIPSLVRFLPEAGHRMYQAIGGGPFGLGPPVSREQQMEALRQIGTHPEEPLLAALGLRHGLARVKPVDALSRDIKALPAPRSVESGVPSPQQRHFAPRGAFQPRTREFIRPQEVSRGSKTQERVLRSEQVGQESGRSVQQPPGGTEKAPTGRVLQKPQEIAQQKPKAVKGKEPWEMMKSEWMTYRFGRNWDKGPFKHLQQEKYHKSSVRQAITEGKIKSHPDYPELTKPKINVNAEAMKGTGRGTRKGKQVKKYKPPPPTAETPKVETPKQAVQEIIEGKRESKIGIKEFKKRMLAELDKIEVTKFGRHETGGKSVVETKIHIPGDGDFTIGVGADIVEIKKRVSKLTEKMPQVDWSKRTATGQRWAVVERKAPKTEGLKEGLESGTVTFTPKQSNGSVELGFMGTPEAFKGLGKSLKKAVPKPPPPPKDATVKTVFDKIDVKGKSTTPFKERIKDKTIRVRSLLEDELYPLEYAERKIRGVHKLDPRKVDPITSPTMIARAVSQTATSKARQMIMHGTFDFAGKTTGQGLRQALQPVAKDMQNFLSYAYAKRAIELHGRKINPGISLEDAQHVVKVTESPTFKKAFEDVVKFEDNVLQYAVEGGVLSKEAAQTIKDLNAAYIPLKRVFEENTYTSLGGRRYADLGSPVKRIKGSERRIKNPLHSIIENTAAIISAADKTRVGKALVELAEEYGTKDWVQKVRAPQQATRVSLERMKKQLEEAGVDISEASMDQVLTVYSNAGFYRGMDNIVSFWKEGKRKFYRVDPRLYRTLKGLDEVHLPAALDFFFGRPARAIRLGATGLNAGFGLITNPMRDAFTYSLQTEFSSGSPHLIAKALAKRFDPKNRMNQLYSRSGADLSKFLGLDQKNLKRAVTDVLASTTRRKALNVVTHPIEGMKEVFSFTESGPRLAEFEKAYKKGEQLYGKESPQAFIMGNLAASDVTVNFRRAGAYGKWMNQITPFWNAQVQGVAKFGRFAREHPVKAGIKAATYLTIPTLAIWNMNKDKRWYRESPSWLKYGFWNLETGRKNKDGTPVIVRIPRPFEWGIVFSVAPEMVMDYWYSKDKAVAKDGLKYMVENTVPVDFPASIKIPIEYWANYDLFRERPIDPYFEVKYKEPEQRFGPYTTETAKFLGDKLGISPRRIDWLTSRTTGGLGRDVVSAAEQIAGVDKGRGDMPADMPVIGRLFQRTETQEKRDQRVKYEFQEEKRKIINKLKAGDVSDAREMREQWNIRYPDKPMPALNTLFNSKSSGTRRGATRRGATRRGATRRGATRRGTTRQGTTR